MTEITLAAEQSYSNPFTDVQVDVDFTGPRSTIIKRPAFWDGNGNWKVRFAPTEPGTWAYSTAATNPADKGLHGVSGNFSAIPYQGELPIYRHGFLKSGGHYFQYNDGTPFFWLSSDVSMINRGRLSESNKRDWDPPVEHPNSQIYGIIERLVQQQFSAVVYWLSAVWDEREYKRGDMVLLRRFQTHYDPIMAFTADRGLVSLIYLGYSANLFAKEAPSLDGMKRLVRYIIARYGAYPAAWTVAEIDAPYVPQPASVKKWGEVLEYAAGLDDYHHPIAPEFRQTAFETVLSNKLPQHHLAKSWVTFNAQHCGHLNPLTGKRNISGLQPSDTYLFYYKRYPQLPMIDIGGCNYEDIWPDIDAHVVRRSAWRAVQAGGAGFGYGANGLWCPFWDYDDKTDCGYHHRITPWYLAIDFPGAWQMAHLSRFYRALPWHTLEPSGAGSSFITWNSDMQDDIARPLVKTDAGRQIIVAYLPGEFNPIGQLGTIHSLNRKSYAASWYDPRDGKYSPIDDDIVPVDGNWAIPPKPSEDDWVLLLTAR
ncbi:MAG: DUF4038 domain-containing protein [Beijerinckiaceae bacterium]|nr:DUF4038 domain-containing protein [Beijerinckiaceae bacterium]MCI0734907.1 DUF4038 domain-containing protein [Beijerinckiaceae bacterium]